MSKVRNKEPIKSETSEKAKNYTILGTYEGECADANITNENGLDIPLDVWTTLFESDLYKQGIDLGWYIGFLGHPDDPGCMDFEHACIVMTEGSVDENGKVHGKFNLIDTPVGRIVKAFQDAGVKFGISVRGAGDIVNNAVDPETFVFRGFDLVTFPAFPESIPTFSEIAASTDIDKRKKYQKVCAAVKKDLPNVESCNAIDVIQSQFAAQSEEFKALESRKQELEECDDETIDIADSKVAGMTELYLDKLDECRQLIEENFRLKSELKSVTASRDETSRKFTILKRITASQMSDLEQICSDTEIKYQTAVTANTKLKEQLSQTQSRNLKYKQKVAASSKLVSDKDATISRLRHQLDETVAAAEVQSLETSNLGEQVSRLKSKLTASRQMIHDREKSLSEFQTAYANLYAAAAGVGLEHIAINASTSVSDLKESISSGMSTSNLPSNVFVEPIPLDLSDDYEDDYEDEIVSC